MRRDLYREMFTQESYYWWHVGKRGLVKGLLKKFAGLGQKKLKILDVGCGTGMTMKDLSVGNEVWGLDGDLAALNFCRKRGFKNLTRADLSKKMPYHDKTFEVILCLDVLEHLKDDRLPLREFRRILKPGGILVITVPAYPQLMSRWDEVSGHYRRYSRSNLESLVVRAGFKIKKLSYFNFFALTPAILIRFIKSRSSKKDYASDFVNLPSWLNQFLLFLTKIEKSVINLTNLPAGLSFICLGQKND